MSDQEIETAKRVDELLGNGCEDTETLLQAAKEQVIELTKLKDDSLKKELEKDELSYGSLGAFIMELETVIYNTQTFIKKLEESHTILLNTKKIYSWEVAKALG